MIPDEVKERFVTAVMEIERKCVLVLGQNSDVLALGPGPFFEHLWIRASRATGRRSGISARPPGGR